MPLLVRLKPYNPKAGHVLRTYVVQGIKFLHDRGWYEVPDALAAYLKTVPQQDTEPNSPFAFDVCTPAEAKAIDEREARAKRAGDQAKATEPNVVRIHAARRGEGGRTAVERVTKTAPSKEGVLTAADLPKPSKPNPSPSFDHEETTDASDEEEFDEEFEKGAEGDEEEGEDLGEGRKSDPPPAKPTSPAKLQSVPKSAPKGGSKPGKG